MKRYWLLAALSGLLFIVLSQSSCGNDDDGEDPAPDPSPQDTCETRDITYTNYVENVLLAQCQACHNEDRQEAGLRLTTYEDARDIAADGALLHAVKGEEDFKIMPPAPAPPLDDCAIEKLTAWVNEGMPE